MHSWMIAPLALLASAAGYVAGGGLGSPASAARPAAVQTVAMTVPADRVRHDAVDRVAKVPPIVYPDIPDRVAESEIFVIRRIDEPGDNKTVFTVIGAIVSPIAKQLADRFAELPPHRRVLIDLDSAGGEMDEGLKIMALIRAQQKQREVDTLVYYAHVCGSMCVPIYMTGQKRFAAATAVMMFHAAHLANSTYPDIPATHRILDTLVREGVRKSWLVRLDKRDLFVTPSEYWVTGEQLYRQRSGIVTKLLPAFRRIPLPILPFDPQIGPR